MITPLPLSPHRARAVPANARAWPLSALSAALALALGCASIDAEALTLGRLNVQSSLGEALRAEIDVTDISAAEADGLKLTIASPESFRSAGIPYSAVLADVRVSLQRRADGRMVIQLKGGRSLNDPFIDLLVEANWSSGRIVRDYTVLLDPPTARQAAVPVAPTVPQTSAVPAPPAAAIVIAPAPPPATAALVPPPAAPAQRAPAPPLAPAALADANEKLTVRAGDTASKIADAHKPAGVSLDQMLVALLRANPDAFVDGNVNRMKSGAVLALPDETQARAAAPDEATRVVKAQSKDFGEYRRRLAENAPASRANPSARQASGKLQASIEERSAASASSDKLKLSHGGAAGSAADDKLAQTRQVQATTARAAELAKNIDALKRLQVASGVTSPAAPSPSASAPVPPVALTLTLPIPIAGPAALASATAASAPAPASTAATPATAASAPAKPIVVAAPEAGFFDGWLDNPLLLGAAALIAALIAFLLYRVLQRRRPDSAHNADNADSVFLESRMPRDSFFGVSGGQQVDTNDRHSSIASTLAYSPSQLDASDVDPVAEADVYLAYGRDLQAEEILREAMRIHPERAAIPLKLLEIHAKRRDLRAFEALTNDVQKLTGGTGPEWERAIELGRDLDPGNPLYLPETAGLAALNSAAVVPQAAAQSTSFMPSVAPLDFDLELPELSAPATTAAMPVMPAKPLMPALSAGSVVPLMPPEFDAAPADPFDPFDTVIGAAEPMHRSIGSPTAQITQPATLYAGLPEESGFIEFDMASLSKRMPLHGDTEPVRLDAADDAGEHPDAIKLSLARELQAIGDTEGARSLVHEVAHEGTGDLQAKARQLLTQLQS